MNEEIYKDVQESSGKVISDKKKKKNWEYFKWPEKKALGVIKRTKNKSLNRKNDHKMHRIRKKPTPYSGLQRT